MKPLTSTRRFPRESQPLALQAVNTRFIALYGKDLSDSTLAFMDRLLAGRSFRPKVIDASQLTAAQAVKEVAANLGREGHLLLCAHGINAGQTGPKAAGTHYVQMPEGDQTLIPTESLVRMIVDQLGIKPNRIDQPGHGLPFIYLFSCHSGALRRQISPGSDLWRRANLLIFASNRQTTMLSSGNSVSAAIAYIDHCQQTMQDVDPLKLLYFAGIHRGDCVTLMGGKLNAPLVWHAPKSGKDQNTVGNLSGSAEDKKRFKEAIGSLSRTEYRLLPAASLTEVVCNRITRDDASRLGELLAVHPELRDARSAFDTFPLEFAAESQASHCLGLLLDAGSDPNRQGRDGETALMEAIRYGTSRIEDVNTLLRHGADPNLHDKTGRTALMFACREGHTDVIHILLAHDANPNLQENDGYTPLMYSVDLDDDRALQLLLAYGADPDRQCVDGGTALMSACKKGHIDAVRILLEGGANPDLRDEDGDTGLIIACRGGHTEIMRLLLEGGANPDLQEMHGLTALMYATAHTDMAPLTLLLAAGARLDLRAGDGRSCLGIAASDRRLEGLKRLLAAGAGPLAGLNQALVDKTRQRNHLQAAALLQQALDQISEAQ